MSLRIILPFLFLVFFVQSSFSVEKDTLVEQIFMMIYNQKFEDAANALSQHKNEMNPFYSNILNLDLYWWKYSLSRTREDAENLKNVLGDFNKLNSNLVEERINKLIKSSYQFRYEVKRYNIIGAMVLRSKIRHEIAEIQHEGIQIEAGRKKLFNLYVALFEYSDNSINPFSIQTKSEACKKSLSEIRKYTEENDLIIQTLAHYFLGRIYLEIENEPEKAKEQFVILSSYFPYNEYFARLSVDLGKD